MAVGRHAPSVKWTFRMTPALVPTHLRSMSLRELVARGVDEPFARVLSAPGEYHRGLETIVGKYDKVIAHEFSSVSRGSRVKGISSGLEQYTSGLLFLSRPEQPERKIRRCHRYGSRSQCRDVRQHAGGPVQPRLREPHAEEGHSDSISFPTPGPHAGSSSLSRQARMTWFWRSGPEKVS